MFVASFPAGPWQANCYVVGADGRGDVVVVDPGVDAAERVSAVVAERGLGVAGVLLTHGHIDHVATAADVADAASAPAWLHGADRELLTDPASGVSMMARMIDQLGIRVREPSDLRLLCGGEAVEVAGLSFEAVRAPGHRPGCVMFRLRSDAEPRELVFSGDVVFAGSVGRTDLPGGDPQAMASTLADVVLALPDEAALLPGHGPETTVARERATNPYLQPSFLRRP